MTTPGQKGRKDQLILRHKGYVGAVRWSPDGRRLASTDWRGWLRVWTPGRPAPDLEIDCAPRRARLSGLAWLDDERLVAAGDEELFLCRADAPAPLLRQDHPRLFAIPRVAASSDGRWLAVQGSTGEAFCVHLYAAEGDALRLARTVVAGHFYGGFLFLSGTPTLLACRGEDGVMIAIDAETGESQPEPDLPRWTHDFGVSADGRSLIAVAHPPGGPRELQVLHVDRSTGAARALDPYGSYCTPVAISADGQRLAWEGVHAGDRLVCVAQADNPESIRAAKRPQGASSLAFSPDGAVLASGSTDKTARLWDLTLRGP